MSKTTTAVIIICFLPIPMMEINQSYYSSLIVQLLPS